MRMRQNPMCFVFPRIVSCNYHRFGTGGREENLNSICILALNIINEKVSFSSWITNNLMAKGNLTKKEYWISHVVLRCTSSFGFGSCSWPLSPESPLSSGLLPYNPTYIWHRTFSLSLCSFTPFFDANCKHKLFQDCPCLCALSAQVGRLQHGHHHRQVRLQVRQQGDQWLFFKHKEAMFFSQGSRGEERKRTEEMLGRFGWQWLWWFWWWWWWWRSWW